MRGLAASLSMLWMLTGLATASATEDAASAEETWQVASRDDDPDAGFVLYTLRARAESGKGTGVLRYRLETRFAVEPREASRVVVEVMTSPQYVPKRERRQILDHSETGILIYTKIDMPMPAADRDLALRLTTEFDTQRGVQRVIWHGAADHPAVPPAADGTVRMTRVEGSWEFRPDGAGHSRATYRNFTDVGGALPNWLIEPMMRNQMTGDASRIRDHLARRPTAVSAGPRPGDSESPAH